MDLRQTVAPTVEPLSLAEAKAHLRVDIADDEDLISDLIKAAREAAEVATNRQFLAATWQLKLDSFPVADERSMVVDCDGSIRLPRPPVTTASGVSITYIDSAGVSQTLATTVYKVDRATEPGRVYLAFNQSWPATRGQKEAVTVQYQAGYGTTATAVPRIARQLVRLMLGDLYENRETAVTVQILPNPTLRRLISSIRVPL